MPTALYGLISREGRNEFQLLIAVMCVLSGLSQLIFNEVPPVLAPLDVVYQYLWAWSLIGGGTLLIVSAVWKNPDPLPTWLEAGGLFTLGLACSAFAFMAFVTLGPASSFSGWITLAAALAMLSRLRRVLHQYFVFERDYEARLQSEVTRQLFIEAAETAQHIIPPNKEAKGTEQNGLDKKPRNP